MEKILVNDEINTLLDNISDDVYMHPSKVDMLRKKIAELKTYAIELNNLDMDLISTLTGDLTVRNGDTIPSSEFQSKMNDIDEDSTIIYLKNAEHYKIYNSEDRKNNFINQINNDFRNKGPIYEVVRDAYPQKLLIVVDEDLNSTMSEELRHIKDYILEFIKKDPQYKNMTEDDIVVYNSNSKTKFLTINFMVKNINERDKFIEGFKRFMKQKGETSIAKKIEIRPDSDIEGARYFDLPLINGVVSNLKHLIVGETHAPMLVINNLTVNVNSNNTTITNNITADDKTLKGFYNHICTNKPSWFIEGKLVNMSDIESAYRDFFDDQTTKTAFISRKLNGSLFKTGTRVNGITKKKLVSFNELKKFK